MFTYEKRLLIAVAVVVVLTIAAGAVLVLASTGQPLWVWDCQIMIANGGTYAGPVLVEYPTGQKYWNPTVIWLRPDGQLGEPMVLPNRAFVWRPKAPWGFELVPAGEWR